MLISPFITEKTTSENRMGKYAFVVALKATKTDVKRLVEKQFGVKVKAVATLTMPGKAYRTGKKWKYAYKADWKKAIVTLEKGQTIDLFDVRTAPTEAVEPEIVKEGDK